MIHFLTTYTANSKYDLVETKQRDFVEVNGRDYTESRVRSTLTVVIESLDGLTYRRFFLINNRFGPEVVFKKWSLTAFGLGVLFLTLL